MFSKVIKAILGPRGRYMVEYGDLYTAYCTGLFRDYHQNKRKLPGRAEVQNCCSGLATPPRWLAQHYAGEKGGRLLQKDVEDFVQSCTSLHRLREIKCGVQTVLDTHGVSAKEIRHSVRGDLTRDEISEYLTDVLQYTLGTMMRS